MDVRMAAQVARQLIDRQGALINAGVSPTLMWSWTWLWHRAGLKRGPVTFRLNEMGLGTFKTPQAASDDLGKLQGLGLCNVFEKRRGRGGFTEVTVNDPLDVLSGPPVVVPPAQEIFDWAVPEPPPEEEPATIPIRLHEKPKSNPGETWVLDRGERKPKSSPAETWVLAGTENSAEVSSLLRTLHEAIGGERWELWLTRCRWEWQAPRLFCLCPDGFQLKLIGSAVRDALVEAGRRIEPDFALELKIDPDPLPPPENFITQVSPGRNLGLGGPLTNQRCSLEPTQGSNEHTYQTYLRFQDETEEERAIVDRADAIYRAIDDTTLHLWIPVCWASLAQLGAIDEPRLEKLIALCRQAGDAKHLSRRCREAGIPWVTQGIAKNHIRRAGVRWRNHWHKSVEDRDGGTR